MTRPVWAGIALRMEDGSVLTWQLDANDGPLRLETSMTMDRTTIRGLMYEKLAQAHATGLIQLDISVHGWARPWQQGADVVHQPLAIEQIMDQRALDH